MEAKDTVMMERGAEYDANCGQVICCDILPKYISPDPEAKCYIEISTIIEEFVESEREVQAEISFPLGEKEGMRKVVEWVDGISKAGQPSRFIPSLEWQAQLKKWGLS